MDQEWGAEQVKSNSHEMRSKRGGQVRQMQIMGVDEDFLKVHDIPLEGSVSEGSRHSQLSRP